MVVVAVSWVVGYHHPTGPANGRQGHHAASVTAGTMPTNAFRRGLTAARMQISCLTSRPPQRGRAGDTHNGHHFTSWPMKQAAADLKIRLVFSLPEALASCPVAGAFGGPAGALAIAIVSDMVRHRSPGRPARRRRGPPPRRDGATRRAVAACREQTGALERTAPLVPLARTRGRYIRPVIHDSPFGRPLHGGAAIAYPPEKCPPRCPSASSCS